MKPSRTLEYETRFLISLFFLFACPLFLSAQTNNKKTAPAPAPAPPPKASAPAPAQKQPGTKPPSGPTTGKPPSGPTTGKPPSGPNTKPTTGPNTKPTTKSPTTVTYSGRPGEQPKELSGGRKEFFNPKTHQTVTTNPRGEVTQIKASRGFSGAEKIVINRGARGGRIVETGRPGARVVSYGRGRGFVERPLRAGYISRTYVRGGRSYARVYREYSYHGVVYYHYVPAFYYGPRFYGWAVTPWGAPVGYVWGGGLGTPWFGFYAGYFTPYPVYASPDLWLTDYLLAENLRLAYENQQADNQGQAPTSEPDVQPTVATLTPEVKALIAEEVRQQLAAEKQAAAQPPSSSSQPPAAGAEQPPPAMSQKFFVVSSSLELTTNEGRPCSLTPGDVIQRKGKVVDTDGGVTAEVVSSKPGDCAAECTTTVQLTDLQDMHNQLREQLDSGLNMLAKNQAKGLPSGPASGERRVGEGNVDPAPDAEKQLVAQEEDATKLEAEVRQN
jgi:hypothetical protein